MGIKNSDSVVLRARIRRILGWKPEGAPVSVEKCRKPPLNMTVAKDITFVNRKKFQSLEKKVIAGPYGMIVRYYVNDNYILQKSVVILSI